jgi:uncharacterized protein related to proFAR isomerase
MIAGMLAVLIAMALAHLSPPLALGADDVGVRSELEQQYHKRAEAYGVQDRKAIASMYTADFDAILSDGQILDVLAEKELDMKTPAEVRYTIRELAVSENRLIAVVEVSREMKWMEKLIGRLRTVSTSHVMRNTWSRTPKGWKLKSVDSIRDEKRFVNGKRVDPDPTKPFDPDAPPYEPPAKEEAPATLPGGSATRAETIDALLARALVTQLDARSALNSTWGLVISKRGGYSQGVPLYLDASAKGIAGDIEELKAVRSDDPNREGARKRLLERLKNLGASVDHAKQAIRAAGAGNGWTPEANGLLDQCWEYYRAGPTVDSSEIKVFSASPTIRKALPRDALVFAGIVQDSCGCTLGAETWVNAPMRIASVGKDSYAGRLGLRAGDEILSIDGRTFESLTELKSHLAAQDGKRVDIVVKRDGGNITLHPKAPPLRAKSTPLPKSSRLPAAEVEVRRELEEQYKAIVEAQGRRDHETIASMYTADFNAILSNGRIIDAGAVKELDISAPAEARYSIQRLAVSENRLIAVVEVFRELKSADTLAGRLRTVIASQKMRQTWSRTRNGWKMKSVDHIRDQRRFVDGKRVDPDPAKPFDPDAPPYQPPAEGED